jgi:hypothetical protein
MFCVIAHPLPQISVACAVSVKRAPKRDADSFLTAKRGVLDAAPETVILRPMQLLAPVGAQA